MSPRGKHILLYEYTGERDSVEELASEYLGPVDMEWQTARIEDAELMYARAEPSGIIQGLLGVLDEHPLVVDWPILFPKDDEAVVTLIGDDAVLRQALSTIPDDIDVRIAHAGEYQPEVTRLTSGLTEREHRALLTAVELGYYQNPRGANYQDIAEELNCSTGTIGAHLRNAESKVMQELMSYKGTRNYSAKPS